MDIIMVLAVAILVARSPSSAIAQIVLDPRFENKWMRARTKDSLRQVIMSADEGGMSDKKAATVLQACKR